MRKFRKNRNNEEEYWKSFTDIMAALLLIVMLIMALLFLYLIQMDEESGDSHGGYGATYDSVTEDDDDNNNPTYPTEHYDERDSGGGGGGGQGETTIPEPTEAPTEGDDYGKAAVFVTVVDEETGNAIKKAGITFELYTDWDRRGGLKKLNTYYPEKIEYSKYQTTANGTFYLPEKLSYNAYSLHNLTAPDTYGAGEDVNFEITRAYDWPEPYLLKVPLAPAKNVIRVHMKDAESEAPVEGYVFEVLANEDIVTLDGTLRFTKNEIVDTFTTDSKGYGESKKLYLGNYRIREKSSPEFYAVDATPTNIKLEAKEEVDVPVNTLFCHKTAFEIVLKDEYSEEPIKGAVFADHNGNESVTDDAGSAVFTDLTKDTTYELSVKSLPDAYKTDATSLSFRVDEKGLIEGEASHKVEHTAYVTRLIVSVKDMLLQNDLSGENISIMDEKGDLVKQFDTVGAAETITGLEPGVYTVKSGDKSYAETTVTIEDNAEPAQAYVYIWTYADFAILFVGLLLIAAVVAVTIFIVKRKRVRKLNEK